MNSPPIWHVLCKVVLETYHRTVLYQVVFDQVVQLCGKHHTGPELSITQSEPKAFRGGIVSLCSELLDTYRKPEAENGVPQVFS